MFAAPDIEARHLSGGEIRLVSRSAPSARTRTTLDWLARWATETPDIAFITEASGPHCSRDILTYGQAWRDAGRIGAGLLAEGLRPGDRLMVVAPNGIAHMRIALAALRTGIIYVPIATQYVAAGADQAKLTAVLDMVDPAAAYCDAAAKAPLLAGRLALYEGAHRLDALIAQADGLPDPDVGELDRDAPAKLLLTSGSTGTPKAVPYSHALMTDNLEATVEVWPFIRRRKPVLVDWLPWNHAFGGSNNVHLVLSQGGTLHIDQSRGRPEAFDEYVANLRAFRPTFHGAVPAGWAALLPALEQDEGFRTDFFGRLDAMFSAGAAMSADLFERLNRVSAMVRGLPVPILAGWGATETGPGATIVHDADARPGWIGTPLPGTEIRLTPSGDKYELRVRGPSVMPGYWGLPELSAAAFDAEGFYRTGDAGRMVDRDRPEQGLMFDGRLLEDFKLANGSWVNASKLRRDLLERAGGALRDVVIVGPNQAYVAALCWTDDPATLDALFAAHNREHAGQTMRIARFAALVTPPSAEAGELTMKGEINRKALLARRPEAVSALYQEGQSQ